MEPSAGSDVPDTGGETLSSFDSAVGYIDSAIPANIIRFRFDAAYNNRPNRAEFFYGQSGPGASGLDYQELSLYLEHVYMPNLSVFLEMPLRWINPEIGANQDGFGDINLGCKWAFCNEKDLIATFQNRLYVPTGDSERGLGTGHVSYEPALLADYHPTQLWTLESEFRAWVPIGGSDFAGSVLRYGVGVSYGHQNPDDCWLKPVMELVGWTVLDGRETVAVPPIGMPISKDASGDTIVNAKLGFRFGWGNCWDLYAGYGRALTGDVWYKDIWRVEMRIAY